MNEALIELLTGVKNVLDNKNKSDLRYLLMELSDFRRDNKKFDCLSHFELALYWAAQEHVQSML